MAECKHLQTKSEVVGTRWLSRCMICGALVRKTTKNVARPEQVAGLPKAAPVVPLHTQFVSGLPVRVSEMAVTRKLRCRVKKRTGWRRLLIWDNIEEYFESEPCAYVTTALGQRMIIAHPSLVTTLEDQLKAQFEEKHG